MEHRVHATRLTHAIRATNTNGTTQFLRHRNAVRKTLVTILADIAGSDWSMADDHILDQIEAWLRDRMSDQPHTTFADDAGLPHVDSYRPEGA
jgi:hypothetical protein